LEKNTRNYIKLFWIWQEERESLWLRDMSLKGWHLKKVTIVLYTFLKGESQDLRYYLDFNPIKAKDLPEYTDIFKDLGWKLICRNGLWYYFASPAENKIKEVYSDNQSKLKKYGLILAFHVMFTSILVNLMNIVSKRLVENNSILNNIVALILFVLLVATTYSTLKFIALVSKLRKDPKE
jgi:hypothetical protein